MAQTIFWTFKQDDSTDSLNRSTLGMLPAGLYRGFDYDNFSSGTTLLLNHTTSGYTEVDAALNISGSKGAIRTKQGAMVIEDAGVTVPLTGNSAGNPRIDYIVCEHEYTAIVGGTAAIYAQVQGTAAASPAPPTLPNPEKQVVIGIIYWPASTTTIQNAVYKKPTVPDISSYGWRKTYGQLVFSQAAAQVNTSNGKMDLDGKGNFYSAGFSFAAINATGLLAITSLSHLQDPAVPNTVGGALIYVKVTDSASSGYPLVLNANLTYPNYSTISPDTYVASGDIITLVEDAGGTYRVVNVFPGTGTPRIVGTSPAPGFQTDWGSGGAAPSFRRDAKGRVWLQGTVSRTTGSGTVPFILPTGYRPSADRVFRIPAGSGSTNLTVETSGNLTIQSVTDATVYALDDVSFDV